MAIADSLFLSPQDRTMPDGYIDQISWLPLQPEGREMLSDITKLSVIDSMILICDRQHAVIQAFSLNGDFLFQIADRGAGPNEYLELAAFTATDRYIYILDNFSNKISVYSTADGAFVRKKDLPFVAWDMEAFDDNDFLFTCLKSHPDANIRLERYDCAVWRTDSSWILSAEYIPVDHDYIELFSTNHYFNKWNDIILFHTLGYDGYFSFSQDSDPVFYPVILTHPAARRQDLAFEDIISNDWQYIGSTPYTVPGYEVIEICEGSTGQQMFAINSLNMIFSNSEESATNLPINIIGSADDCFIGYIGDDPELYDQLTGHGFPGGNSRIRDHIANGGECLVFYRMK